MQTACSSIRGNNQCTCNNVWVHACKYLTITYILTISDTFIMTAHNIAIPQYYDIVLACLNFFSGLDFEYSGPDIACMANLEIYYYIAVPCTDDG